MQPQCSRLASLCIRHPSAHVSFHTHQCDAYAAPFRQHALASRQWGLSAPAAAAVGHPQAFLSFRSLGSCILNVCGPDVPSGPPLKLLLLCSIFWQTAIPCGPPPPSPCPSSSPHPDAWSGNHQVPSTCIMSSPLAPPKSLPCTAPALCRLPDLQASSSTSYTFAEFPSCLQTITIKVRYLVQEVAIGTGGQPASAPSSFVASGPNTAGTPAEGPQTGVRPAVTPTVASAAPPAPTLASYPPVPPEVLADLDPGMALPGLCADSMQYTCSSTCKAVLL